MSGNAATDITLLLRGVRAPLHADTACWERVLRLARVTGLHARLAQANRDNATLPDVVRRHLLSAARIADFRSRMLRAELYRLAPLCRGDFPVVLLKGAAYSLQQRAVARGRFVSDVDLLVPREHLRSMEERMHAAGWQAAELDPYDERYYRDWSHEIPPMRFPVGELEVDLHHAITPLTGTLRFDPALLFDRCEPIAGTPFLALCAEDQLLHAAVHCFHDGDLDLRVREVVDIDGLLREFAAHDGFWDRLLERAAQLGLQQPLWYALHYAQRWFACPLPPRALAELPAPTSLARRVMDVLLPLAMLPSDPDRPAPRRARLARRLMMARYHLMRMPTALLVPHLMRKSVLRLRDRLRSSPRR